MTTFTDKLQFLANLIVITNPYNTAGSPVYYFLPILLLLLILIVGCRKEEQSARYRWPELDPAFDSITAKLEDDFYAFSSPETIHHSIKEMDKIIGDLYDDSRKKEMTARKLYWQSKYERRFGSTDSAHTTISKALSLVDSTRYYYDWLRLKSQYYLTSRTTNGVDVFNHYEKCLEEAKRTGDRPFEATTLINLGNIMGAIGENEKGLSYLRQADSIWREVGFLNIPVKNRINEASLMKSMGKTREADSLLRSLVGHPALKGDTFAMNLIPRNLYSPELNNSEFLFEAYDQIKDNPKYRDLRGLYRALLSQHYLSADRPDSMRIYATLMMEDLPYVIDFNHKAIIWYSRSIVWEKENRPDSALKARILFEAFVDSTIIQDRIDEIIRLNTLEEMRKREAHTYMMHTRRIWIMVALIILCIGGAGIVILLLNRRNLKQRLVSTTRQLELEKAKRKIAATALSIEEKDNILHNLRDELSEMRKDGEIREGSARRIESAIKTHFSDKPRDETFRDMFDTVNPHFMDRLREKCPNLADSYIKLACYLLMDLDNKKIASLLMIKAESVHQARWRLRQRLNIPDGITLEQFLRDLNS